MHEVILQDLGIKPYKQVWDYQENCLQQKIKAKQTAVLQNPIICFLLNIHPVYTLRKKWKRKKFIDQ